MKVHFIAIGGSAMHNLAIALHLKGYTISGSDDEIFEPSKSRLEKYGILPKKIGWDKRNINKDIDAVILGMHAKADNPELLRAKDLGLKIFSYPEYLYELSKSKIRVVIGGSHGKTTITAMILHVMKHHNINTDYMVGAQLEGFDIMVKLSDDAPYMILEGDEYLSSPIDKRPKFHLYKPNIALISGIAWDHINVFPTFEDYMKQFKIFIEKIVPGGKLIYCDADENVKKLSEDNSNNNIEAIPYSLPEYLIENEKTKIIFKDKTYDVSIFGKHNLLNLNGARKVCNQLGITDAMFFEAIKSYKGASKRMEIIYENNSNIVFKDFAHAPSKIKATTEAAKEQYPEKKLIAVIELHTYSSLNKEFLQHYKNTLEKADKAFIYYNPHTLKIKKLPELDIDYIKSAFDKEGSEVFVDSKVLFDKIKSAGLSDTCLLFMSSGNFDGIDLNEFTNSIFSK